MHDGISLFVRKSMTVDYQACNNDSSPTR